MRGVIIMYTIKHFEGSVHIDITSVNDLHVGNPTAYLDVIVPRDDRPSTGTALLEEFVIIHNKKKYFDKTLLSPEKTDLDQFRRSTDCCEIMYCLPPVELGI